MSQAQLTYTREKPVIRANTYISPRSFFFILLGLGVAGLFIRYFSIEADLGLPQLVPFILIGFMVNTWLPVKLRLPFFFLVNVTALLVLYGVLPGLLVTGIGLGLLGICHLPVARPLRIGLILIVAGILAACLIGWIRVGPYRMVATVLGALFMFRLMVYLYELPHEKQPVGPWKRISYFFLLPNLIFFIFPVVDYKTFVRNYYERPAAPVYRKGLRWIVRGLTHLFLYRLVYYYLVPAPTDVEGLFLLVQYLVTTYLLILRLSGIFHFAAGVVCLFGFDLPPTFNNYFLASGFNDLWRRINTYWRDFMMKVFYFPIYFRFKKRNARAMVMTILILFAINWFLHSYQWFWVRGTFPLKATDLIFWSVFGILVAANSVAQRNRKKAKEGPYTFTRGLGRAVRTLGMFAFMCTLYTFWISETPEAFGQIVLQGMPDGVHQPLLLLGLLVLVICIGATWFWADRKYQLTKPENFSERELALPLAAIALLALLASPVIRPRLETTTGFDLSPVWTTQLNRADQERMYRGYYESIIAGNDFTSNVSQLQRLQPENWDKLHATGILITEDGLLRKRLRPDTSVQFKETKLQTNAYGLRDREYPQTPAAGSLRIALLGTSIEMGSGVETGETYENRLEDRLNTEPIWTEYEQIEILNFALSGIHLPQQVYLMQQRVPDFQPDVVIYTAHPNEETRAGRQFARLIESEEFRAFPFLDSLYQRAELSPDLSYVALQRKLMPYRKELVQWSLRQIAAACEETGAVPLWVYVPSYGENPRFDENVTYAEYVRSLGFFTFDLNEVFEGQKAEDISVRPWDRHPSVLGHQLLADELYRQMEADTAFRETVGGRKE